VSNNLQRILTAIVAGPVVLLLAYIGGWPFAGLIALIGLLGQVELYRLARTTGAHPNLTGGLVLGLFVVGGLMEPSLWPLVGLWLVAFLVLAPFLLPQSHFLASLTSTLTGAVYPTGLLGSLVLLRTARSAAVDADTAFWLVVLTFLLVWATDVSAYYVGKGLGERPLAKSISPNKTWEGTLGGLGAAVLVALVLKILVLDVLAWPHVLAVAGIGGGISQVGDLMESQLKRSTDVDDSGSLLPGHGGILDRFDAMVVAAPLIYLYLREVAGLL
jgi:phosphatidate cytidylyltransferase